MCSFPGSYGNRGSGTEQASSDVVTRTGLDLRCGGGRLGLQGAPGALPRALGFESRGRREHQKQNPAENRIGGSPVRTSDSERKKETADVELSRQALIVARFPRVAMHLRKPGKRNGAGFF